MKLIIICISLYLCISVGWGSDTPSKSDVSEMDRSSAKSLTAAKKSDKERFFFTTGALNLGNTGTTSVTIGNAGYIALGSYILIPLIIGLALVFYLFGGPGPIRRGDYVYDYYSRNVEDGFDPYAIDWEKFSILDWIAIGEEAWKKFDPADLECQKRLICEIHQNTAQFGPAAARMVDLFSYVQYAEILSLPEEIKVLAEEYLDAADKGRNIQKDCGEVYDTCDFSVKSIIDRYSKNAV